VSWGFKTLIWAGNWCKYFLEQIFVLVSKFWKHLSALGYGFSVKCLYCQRKSDRMFWRFGKVHFRFLNTFELPVAVTANAWGTHTGDGQNSWNTRQYMNNTVCVGFTEQTLVVSIFCYSFLCLHCIVPVLRYRLCLVTVCMKVLQNRRLVRFSERVDCWCAFSQSICNQSGQFIRCIQSSSLQGYYGIHKSWGDFSKEE